MIKPNELSPSEKLHFEILRGQRYLKRLLYYLFVEFCGIFRGLLFFLILLTSIFYITFYKINQLFTCKSNFLLHIPTVLLRVISFIEHKHMLIMAEVDSQCNKNVK